MFKLNNKRSVGEMVRGFFQNPIQYEDRLKGRKWISYAGQFQPQRWGRWDSFSCWVLGGCVNSMEDQLELLYADNLFSQEAKNFFHDNGYIDEDGDFSISELFYEKLGNRGIQGGTAEAAWQMAYKYGILPRKKLDYSLERSQKCSTEEEFVADYFNKAEITPEMYALAKKSKKYITTAYQPIGKKWFTPSNEILTTALQMAPVCVGIPIPSDVFRWNSEYVQYDGNTKLAHEVELHFVEPDGTKQISDQYNPPEKRLSPGYPLYICTQGIVYSLSKPLQALPPVVLTPEQTFLEKLWTSIYNYWAGIPNPFPIG